MRRKTIDKSAIVKPCFAYPGGKTRLLDQILPLIPDHNRYIEPFAGGLAVLLAKPRAKVEVINDLDYEVANFYRYVRFHFDALVTELEPKKGSFEPKKGSFRNQKKGHSVILVVGK
jgi:site-specific DNA-adenine methylase